MAATAATEDARKVADSRVGARRPHALTVFVVVAGLLLTSGLAFAARSVHEDNEKRLLRQRTREAAAVLTTAIPSIQNPLASTSVLAQATNGQDATAFQRLLGPLIGTGTGKVFVHASVWRATGATFVPVFNIGVPSRLSRQPAVARDRFLRDSMSDDQLHVTPFLTGKEPRLGYSFTVPPTDAPQFVSYAEAALPPDRKSVVRRDSAFSGLANAVYLGGSQRESSLLTASTARLPLRGHTAVEHVPFGNTELLLVMAPDSDLGGRLLASLPWIIAAVGAIATLGVAMLVEWTLRRRDSAQALARQNAALMTEQRTVAQTLQHSLLPERLPQLGAVEFGARYIPGTAGIDIGGDWYDVVQLDADRAFIAVGDVSGRGLQAGTIMAALRYAIRAFASLGHSPAEVLRELSGVPDVGTDGHFATVICAVIDARTRDVVIANAGHPPPLLIDAGGARFIDTAVGVPVGVLAAPSYEEMQHTVTATTTLLFFTDGLFERRGETNRVGLERLRSNLSRPDGALESLLDHAVASQHADTSSDDTALLGVQWNAEKGSKQWRAPSM